MTAVLGAAVGDVLWSVTFLAHHALVVLVLSAIPAAQRFVAALHPDDPRAYAWPIEALVAALRVGTLGVVFWLGSREDAAAHRESSDTIGEALGTLSTYCSNDWPRLLVGALLAAIIFAGLNPLAGPAMIKLVRYWRADPRIANAWVFGVRNLLIIPLWYAIAYGLVRPAFVPT